MCRALYSVHSFKPVLDSLSEQPNSQLSAFPEGVMVGSHCYCSQLESCPVGFSRAISPECQYPIRGLLEFLASTRSGRTNQSLRIFRRRLWGQLLPFALCVTCIKVKLKFYGLGGRVSALKCLNQSWITYVWFISRVFEVHCSINCLHFWLFFLYVQV